MVLIVTRNDDCDDYDCDGMMIAMMIVMIIMLVIVIMIVMMVMMHFTRWLRLKSLPGANKHDDGEK